MPYVSLQQVLNDINLKIITNNNKDIEGAQLNEILKGICQFISPQLNADLIVQLGANQSVGGADDGEIFTQGTTLETVIRDILTKAVHPSYIMPTLTLSTTQVPTDFEIGQQLTSTFTSIYNQQDAGSIATMTLKRNGAIVSNAFPFTETAFTLIGQTLYQANVGYNAGAVKNNNLGQPDPFGRIQSGNVGSNTITFNAYRKWFGGTPNTIPVASIDVRALSNAILNPIVGSEMIINIPIGAKTVAFAYPAALEDVISVKYLELSNSEVRTLFTKTSVSVESANAYDSVSYKVFTFTPVEPFQTIATYKVTI